ncbi:phosphatase PAP2 family protein [Gallaecimonas sp. GXIMD1310]|uniref:phosphatase PAP2 family protein n=1 Tax=Gallaecimonas sp. GXIMD1310 TaxID=3131926 RepID=UPI00324E1153
MFKPLLAGLLLAFTSLACQAKTTTESAGDILRFAIPAAAVGTTLLKEQGNEGLIQFSKALVASQLATLALKKSINKRRPNGKCCDAFPSGHSSMAFMGAAYLQQRYGWRYGLPAYLAASYVGYTRVQSKQHDTSDVLAGAAIGVLSSYYFTTSYKGFTVTPVAGSHYMGLSVSGKF